MYKFKQADIVDENDSIVKFADIYPPKSINVKEGGEYFIMDFYLKQKSLQGLERGKKEETDKSNNSKIDNVNIKSDNTQKLKDEKNEKI